MPANRERHVGRAENNLANAAEAARNPEKSGDELVKAAADDRGGSRDGERTEPGEPGDRGQLDDDDGLRNMK